MTDQERKSMEMALEALRNNKRNHYYCEDTWYSCPKHEEGCANDSVDDECNCGADKANQEIDFAMTTLRQALAQPEQEPFGYVIGMGGDKYSFSTKPPEGGVFGTLTRVYTAPPSKPWVSLTDEDIRSINHKAATDYEDGLTYARAIEAALKEKNT